MNNFHFNSNEFIEIASSNCTPNSTSYLLLLLLLLTKGDFWLSIDKNEIAKSKNNNHVNSCLIIRCEGGSSEIMKKINRV